MKSVDTQDLKSCAAGHASSILASPTINILSGQSHQLDSKQQEILDITQEECAEVIQSISKCRRFGINNSHKNGQTQRENLTQEIGDMLCMIDLMLEHNIVDLKEVEIAKQTKRIKLTKWSKIFD